MHAFRFALLAVALLGTAVAQDKPAAKHTTENDIPYRTGEKLTAAVREACKLDVHFPDGGADRPVVVWIHGGGLTGGDKAIPAGLTGKGGWS